MKLEIGKKYVSNGMHVEILGTDRNDSEYSVTGLRNDGVVLLFKKDGTAQYGPNFNLIETLNQHNTYQMKEEKLILGEPNKFLPIDKIDLYQDSIGYVKLYDASHANESEAQRIWTVTTIASLAYGNESAKNPEALYERMKSIKHESLWEFIRYGYGSCGIDSSMRAQPVVYKNNYSHYVTNHKQNIACFRIKVPIFVARQFMRHRSFSYLEMSRRYTKGGKIPFEFWFPKRILGKFFTKEQPAMWIEEYNNLITIGLETQVASRFLPQTTYTEFYCMAETEGLRNFLNLRMDSHAQAEIRECAEAMLELLVRHQPELAKKVMP